MKDKKKHIVLKGNKELDKRITKSLKRKELVRKLIQSGASIEKIREIAPI